MKNKIKFAVKGNFLFEEKIINRNKKHKCTAREHSRKANLEIFSLFMGFMYEKVLYI
jgi:hypothetical protein